MSTEDTPFLTFISTNEPLFFCLDVAVGPSWPEGPTITDRPPGGVRGACCRGDLTHAQLSSETAREITRARRTNAPAASSPIMTLARDESGMVSVGLKAMELESEKYA